MCQTVQKSYDELFIDMFMSCCVQNMSKETLPCKGPELLGSAGPVQSTYRSKALWNRSAVAIKSISVAQFYLVVVWEQSILLKSFIIISYYMIECTEHKWKGFKRQGFCVEEWSIFHFFSISPHTMTEWWECVLKVHNGLLKPQCTHLYQST